MNLNASIFSTVPELISSSDYLSAKRGDAAAAIRLAQRLINPIAAKLLVQSLPFATNICPVIAMERMGDNRIPHAMAWELSRYGHSNSVAVDTSVIQNNKVFHTGATAAERLIRKPSFEGPVQPGGKYFIVDDVVTTGSSINELSLHIKKNGGEIVGCACLGASYSKIRGSSTQISMEEDTITGIVRKFDTTELNKILINYGYKTFREITNSQGKYLLSFNSLDSLRKRISEAENRRSHRNIQKVFPGWEREGVYQQESRGVRS